MSEQPDFWPLMAPKSDPDTAERERWRLGFLLLAAANLEVMDHTGLERWVRRADATPADLFAMLYYDPRDIKQLTAEALELLREKGLIE